MMLAMKLATLELRLHTFVAALEQHYRPDQPRVPAGRPEGGQWTSIGRQVRRTERVRTAFAAVKVFERQGPDPIRGLARQCFYRDMLDRHFMILPRGKEECPPTYPADPTGE